MDTNASVQKEDKADRQSPQDESTNYKLQSVVQVKKGELIIVRPRAQVWHDMKTNPEARKKMKERLFPWAERAPDDLNKAARIILFNRYSREHDTWSDEMWKEFHVVAPIMDYSIREKCEITDHPICTEASAGFATWIHAWFLQVLFGSFVCKSQSWIEALKKEYPVIHEDRLSRRHQQDVFFWRRIIDGKRQHDLKYHNQKMKNRARKIINVVKNHDDKKIRRLLEKKPHMETDLAKAIQNVLSSQYPVETISD
ncbi:hypothetical protein GGI42DRAFT_65687 [Trichoderma sp. SZMC 28013]